MNGTALTSTNNSLAYRCRIRVDVAIFACESASDCLAGWSCGGVFGGEEEGGGVRSGPGEARTILLLHIISVRPSKQPLMVRTFLKVYMELGSYFLFLQEQIKDIIIIFPAAHALHVPPSGPVYPKLQTQLDNVVDPT